MSFGPAEFRATLGRFATGVSVVTTCAGTHRAGITVNALASVSLDPPMVLICIDRTASIHDVLTRAGFFAINLLREDQQDLCGCFAGASEFRYNDFCGASSHEVATGAPVLDDSLGFIDCHIAAVYPGGDHSIFLGQVEALGAGEGQPLLFFRGGYPHLETSPR